MTARPRLDVDALAAVMAGTAPAGLDRAGRIKLLGEAARSLLRGELPERQAALFLGGAVLSWLESGGNLEKDFLKVIANGSHHTPTRMWKALTALPLKGTTGGAGDDTMPPSSED